MLIVKLGGSLITNKEQYKVFRKDIAYGALKEIMKRNEPFIIVHGAGSFGHIICKQNGFPGPFKGKESAFSTVKSDVLSLNAQICSILLDMGRAPLPFSPVNLFNGTELNYHPVINSFRNGFVPVLYGDAYMNENQVKIYSGDYVMQDLSEAMKPDRAVFMGDVDGIFDADPKKFPNAKLIRKISIAHEFEPPENDVTGGMNLKFDVMKKIASMGIKTYFMNGLYPERINDLEKNDFMGTVIE